MYADTMTWVSINLRCTMQLHVELTMSPVRRCHLLKRWQTNVAREAAVFAWYPLARVVTDMADSCWVRFMCAQPATTRTFPALQMPSALAGCTFGVS
jgi:hypothetical protein